MRAWQKQCGRMMGSVQGSACVCASCAGCACSSAGRVFLRGRFILLLEWLAATIPGFLRDVIKGKPLIGDTLIDAQVSQVGGLHTRFAGGHNAAGEAGLRVDPDIDTAELP